MLLRALHLTLLIAFFPIIVLNYLISRVVDNVPIIGILYYPIGFIMGLISEKLMDIS